MTGIKVDECDVAGIKLDDDEQQEQQQQQRSSGDGGSGGDAAAAAPSQPNGTDDDDVNATLPAVDDGALMAFLQGALAELEAAQGGAPDEEARALLGQLELATTAAHRSGTGSIGSGGSIGGIGGIGGGINGGGLAGELEIAAACDGLSAQLSAIEASFAALDSDARRLVAAGASAWVGGGGGGGVEAGGVGSVDANGSSEENGHNSQEARLAPINESNVSSSSDAGE
jgi:hypothetical protein